MVKDHIRKKTRQKGLRRWFDEDGVINAERFPGFQIRYLSPNSSYHSSSAITHSELTEKIKKHVVKNTKKDE